MVEFGEVAALEFVPAVRIVAEPLAELMARPDVVQPAVHPQCVPTDAARPQPFNQEPAPALVLLAVVDAGQPDVPHGFLASVSGAPAPGALLRMGELRPG